MYDNDNWHMQQRHGEDGKLRPKWYLRRGFIMIWAIGSTALVLILVAALLLNRVSGPSAPVTGGQRGGSAQPTSQPSSGNTPAPVATSSPTPVPTTAVTAGTVLCQYDATTGFKSWVGSPEWKQISDGTLGSDGSSDGSTSNGYITWSDCKLPTANYAVEAQVQYVRSTNNGDFQFEFGVMLRGDGDKNGYEVGVGASSAFGCSASQAAMVTLVQDGQGNNDHRYSCLSPLPGAAKDYSVDNTLHTDRAEISGNTITLLIDGRQLLQTSDNAYTDAGQVGLRDIYGDINIKSFKVTAL